MKLTVVLFVALLASLSLRLDAEGGRPPAHVEHLATASLKGGAAVTPFEWLSQQWAAARTMWDSLVTFVVRVLREAVAMVVTASTGPFRGAP